MAEPLAAAGSDYLEQLLRAAVSVPAAAGDPASGRIAGSLLASLGDRHEDERLEAFFAARVGPRDTYELRCYDETDQIATRTASPRAGPAIRAAAQWVGQDGRSAEIIATAESGSDQRLLVIRDRTPIYQLAKNDAAGHGAPASEVPGGQATGGVAAPGRPVSSPTASEVVETLRQMLAGMTVHVDATAIEEVLRESIDELRRDSDELARAVAVEVARVIPSATDIAAWVVGSMTPGMGGVTTGEDPLSPTGTHASSGYETLDPAAQDALATERAGDGQPPPGR